MSQHQEYVEDLEAESRNSEEVHRYQVLHVILQKSAPSLRWRLPVVAKLQGQTHQFRIRGAVGIGEVFQKPLARLAQLGSDLGQPDGGFHSFDLTKEGPNLGELVMTPVLEDTLGVGCDLPIVWIGETAPLVHVVAEFVDLSRSRLVLLLL